MDNSKMPLRVDFAGGWLDVPSLMRSGAYIVNCAIQPLVSLDKWYYQGCSGLGGSAAWSVLNGNDAITTELQSAGWQDPAVILETGLCVWRSGPRPVLEAKFNPDWLEGCLALVHTGKHHNSASLRDLPRNYDKIAETSLLAFRAADLRSKPLLADAINLSYQQQIEEGMEPVSLFGCLATKYCGSGHGGYLVCLFQDREQRSAFVSATFEKPILIEPYLRSL